MKKFFLLILIGLCIILVVFTILIYLRFQNEMHAARERSMAGSQIIETASDPIEYAMIGAKPF